MHDPLFCHAGHREPVSGTHPVRERSIDKAIDAGGGWTHVCARSGWNAPQGLITCTFTQGTIVKRLISKIWSPRRILCLGAVAIGVGCTTEDLPTEPQGAAASRQPAAARSVAHGDTVIRYIVRLKNGPGGVANRAESLILPYRGKLSIVFERVFQGFVAEGLTPAAAALLAKSPVVEYIEKEGFSYAGDVQTLTFSSQWGLDRIDQRAPPIDNQ